MKKWISGISLVVIIGIFYMVLHLLGIGCPIRFLTGIPCMGCGMTRAWISVLHLDFFAAWHYHPLYFLVPIMLLFFTNAEKLSQKKRRLFEGIVGTVFIVVYLIRVIKQEDVVNIRLSEGFLFRFFTAKNVF